MKMKKLVAAALAMAMALSLAACGGGQKPPAQSNQPSSGSQAPAQSGTPAPGGATEITAWIYPVGGWQDENNVKPLIEIGRAHV